jgi:MFS transporter, UMF1 family
VALVIMLVPSSRRAPDRTTFVGLTPPFGLDPAREGTRFVGPLTAVWFAVFMIPFFLWVRDPQARAALRKAPCRLALRGLRSTIRLLRARPSLFAFLGPSMFYRDALNGIYVFGGIYAAGVLGWSVVDTGIFGILAIIFGAVFAWLGGQGGRCVRAETGDRACILALTAAAVRRLRRHGTACWAFRSTRPRRCPTSPSTASGR